MRAPRSRAEANSLSCLKCNPAPGLRPNSMMKREFAKSCSGLADPTVSHQPIFLGRKQVVGMRKDVRRAKRLHEQMAQSRVAFRILKPE